jgi:hypothetical protein
LTSTEMRTRYIVLHSMVDDVVAGKEYVPAKGVDIDRLIALGAVGSEVVPVNAALPPESEGVAEKVSIEGKDVIRNANAATA